MAESVSLYSLSRTWASFLFLLVLLLQLAVAFLFGRAALEPEPFSRNGKAKILQPFFVAIVLFCGFLVFDEMLLIYRRFPGLETTHFVILCALLLSLLLIRLLDDPKQAA